MKKLIKAIVITGMCFSSVSSAFSPKEETVAVKCTYCILLAGQRHARHAPKRVKLTRERLANLRVKINVSAKSGSKLTSEDLIDRVQKKDGYIYAQLHWWESKTSNDETYILGSNQSRLDDRLFIFNLKD
jgi:hypothetical protein